MSTTLADLTLDKTGSEIAMEVASPTDDTSLHDNVDTGVQVKQIWPYSSPFVRRSSCCTSTCACDLGCSKLIIWSSDGAGTWARGQGFNRAQWLICCQRCCSHWRCGGFGSVWRCWCCSWCRCARICRHARRQNRRACQDWRKGKCARSVRASRKSVKSS